MKLTSRAAEVLGSHIEIQVPAQKESILEDCFAELKRIEHAYSRFRPDSVISRINANLGIWQEIPAELASLVETALRLQKETDGYFDITVKSTLDRLGYDSTYSFTEKKAAPERKGFLSRLFKSTPIHLDVKHSRIKLAKQIEIGGFGKGYAIDRIRAILDKHAVSQYFINAGGDVYAKRGDREMPWEVGLENPDDLTRALGTVRLQDAALACSAPTRRRWKNQEGRDLHHLIDPKTGEPQRSVKAIFVRAKTGLEADGYATALFAAGYETAIMLSRRLPVSIFIIATNGKMFLSNDFDAKLYLKSEESN